MVSALSSLQEHIKKSNKRLKRYVFARFRLPFFRHQTETFKQKKKNWKVMRLKVSHTLQFVKDMPL